MNIRRIYILFFLLTGFISNAQKKFQQQPFMVEPPVCYASPEVRKIYIPPPAEFENSLKSTKKSADIVVNYIGFPDSIKPAFEYAVSIWESLISSSVPIHIQASWATLANNVLGSCGPEDFLINFKGAPLSEIYYPIALAEKLMGEQVSGPGVPDMKARFNSTVPWYFGTDGKTPVDKYDFVSTVLHEIAHGLGFTGFFGATVSTMTGYSGDNSGRPAIYDLFVQDFFGISLTDSVKYPNPSEALYKSFTSNLLYSGSYLGTLWGSGSKPRVYAPNPFNNGSSLYHLNSMTYSFGDANSLMTHAAGKGEAIHSPGPITIGILADMGWKHLSIEYTPLKDRERNDELLVFSASVKSDIGLDTASFFLVYSIDGFASKPDSVRFGYDHEAGSFMATLMPENRDIVISYYLTANDSTGRDFTLPGLIPEDYFILRIGDDVIKPEITHSPPSFVLSTQGKLVIEADVIDNLGIDTVYVLIKNRGVELGRVPLLHTVGSRYSGEVNFATFGLDKGGILEYNIIATDAARTPNVSVAPEEGIFSVTVERIFQPIAGYFSDFNDGPNDFIVGDFSILQRKGFDNPALHSPNPYPSPGEDNKTFDFITMLRYPIIVQENGAISFDEVVLVEPGEAGTTFGDAEFWDYVVVEASKDNGTSWLPLLNGYDSKSNASWLIAYNSNISGQDSRAIGSKDLFINRQFSITANGNVQQGDTILIRFRLFSDPYAHGWGWAIDNLRVQQPVSNRYQVQVSPGHILLWPNPFNDYLHWAYTAETNADELIFEVFDLTGRMIKNLSVVNVLPGMRSTISTHDIPPGFCIISVKADNIPVTRIKVLKY